MSTQFDMYRGLRDKAMVYAAALCGSHIGEVVTFTYRTAGAQLSALVIGELRQISHGPNGVDVSLQAHDRDTGATLAEFSLDPDDELMIMTRQ